VRPFSFFIFDFVFSESCCPPGGSFPEVVVVARRALEVLLLGDLATTVRRPRPVGTQPRVDASSPAVRAPVDGFSRSPYTRRPLKLRRRRRKDGVLRRECGPDGQRAVVKKVSRGPPRGRTGEDTTGTHDSSKKKKKKKTGVRRVLLSSQSSHEVEVLVFKYGGRSPRRREKVLFT